MWHLKIRYKHTDCVYTGAVTRLGLQVQYYTINSFRKGNFIYATSLQIVRGRNVNKYYNFLKKHERVTNIEREGHIFLVEVRQKRRSYEKVYSSEIFNPSPRFIGNGEEIIELASWSREPLEKILKGFQKAENTLLIEVIYFRHKPPEDVYLARVVSSLPERQQKAIILAHSLGYYSFPREVNLEKMARMEQISKPAFRENLRKAEAKIIPIISQG